MQKATVYFAGKNNGVNLYIPDVTDQMAQYEAINDVRDEWFPNQMMETIMPAQDTSLFDIIGEDDGEEAIQLLIEAIEYLGVETKIAQYLHSRGYDKAEDEE